MAGVSLPVCAAPDEGQACSRGGVLFVLTLGLSLAVGCVTTTPKETSTRTPVTVPPSPEIELEPGARHEERPRERIASAPDQDPELSEPKGQRIRHLFERGALAFDLWVTFRPLPGGRMGLELNTKFENLAHERETIFDLGREPHLSLMVVVEAEDGSGHGGSGSCTLGSTLHGVHRDPLRVGAPRTEQILWDEGIGPGERLELGVALCGVKIPDGRMIYGPVAEVHLVLDGQGELARFELAPVVPPEPR